MEKDLKSEIDHVVTLVNDLEQSIHWYTTSFGCELIHRGKRLAILDFKNIKLVLSLPGEQQTHIAVIKDNAGSFGEIIEQDDLCFSTFISDPSGNPVELVTNPFTKVPEG